MIQSVDRAAQILKVLGSGVSRLGITELSERLGLAKPTVHGLLRTLEAQQLVEQDPDTGKYRLGPALLQLGNAYLDNHELRARSLLWAESLASRTREAVRVSVLYGPTVLIIHHVFRPDNSVQMLEVGASIPWNACAWGKAIVAHLGAPERGRTMAGPFPQLTGRTITTKQGLEQELRRVRKGGIATENEEAILGEAGLAAAVFDDTGLAVAAIGVTGPVERLMMPDGPEPSITLAVKEAGRAVSRELGGGRVAPRATGTVSSP